MAQKGSASLRERARADAEHRPPPDLSRLRQEAERWRSLTERKRDLEEQLKQTNVQVANAEFDRLPSLMDELGVESFTLAPDGNHPAVELEVRPHYHANIAADWSPAQRAAAFAALEKANAGDLIRTEVQVLLPREEHSRLAKLLSGLRKAGFDFTVRESVHFGTLTAWVKEQAQLAVEQRKKPTALLPPLEVIGARIGRICRPKIKEDQRG